MVATGGAMRVRARVVVGALLAASALLVGAAPSGAQEAPRADEVTLETAFGVGGQVARDCDGAEEVYPGFVLLQAYREVIGGGDPTTELSVGVTYSGPEAANLLDPPSEVRFAAGELFTGISLDLREPGTGSLTLTLEPGAGYVLVEPATTKVDLSTTEVVNDCGAPLTSDGDAEQTIAVGQVPDGFFPLSREPGSSESSCVLVETDGGAALIGYCALGQDVDLFDEYLDTPVVGDLPPGLAYADDTWTGAATTPGVYPFDVRLCEDLGALPDDESLVEQDLVADGTAEREARRDQVARRSLGRAAARAGDDDLSCVGTLAAEVTVVAVPTPAAVPVAAAARFTG